MTDLVHVAIVGLALFLIGSNLAFIIHLGGRLVPWFTFKICAVTLLLVYVATSAVWGDPAWWRLLIGVVALLTDTLALYRMWTNISHLAERGIVGLVPILRPETRQDSTDGLG